jgi:hypothetical protein
MITSSGRGSGSGSADERICLAKAPCVRVTRAIGWVCMTVALSSSWSATSGIDHAFWQADRGSVDWTKLAILLFRIEGDLHRS